MTSEASTTTFTVSREKIINRFCAYMAEFLRATAFRRTWEKRAPEHYLTALVQEIERLRKTAYRVGIRDLDRYYFQRRALELGDEYYVCGGQTYTTADKIGAAD
jgi:hypothetical protein